MQHNDSHFKAEENKTISTKFATKEKIREIEKFRDNSKLMIKFFFDESKTFIFLDNITK